MTHVTHNAPLLTTLTHASQQKSAAKAGVYSKVIHNLKLGVEKVENFSA
jgi:hypothetical protein